MLPDPIVDALPPSARVVEVGVGGRFEALEDLARRRPDAELAAVDVHVRHLEAAPEEIATHVDDVRAPRATIYRRADLVFARRPPAELQRAIARLARAHGASLALRSLKDEWVDLTNLLGPPEVPAGEQPWRWWPAD